MKNLKYFAQKYVDWVIRLGRIRFSLLGVCILAVFALFMQIVVSLIFIGTIYWQDVARSIIFGLFSAPFVLYFFTLLVEKLEKSRLDLAKLVDNLRNEVSDRILAERKLSVALNEIEKTSRDKTALMATISHELRTPLNGIIGLSRILLDDQLTEQQRNYLKTINVSAISLGHIFSDIIDLEKIDAHRIELHYQETDFHSFLNDITNFATLMAEQRKLKFELECDKDLPDWLMLDSARLSQILWNLINNAVKFTPTGKLKLKVSRLTEDAFSFALSDTGVGIAEQELDKIFTMYYQVQETDYKPAGSGIGLAVSKTIAGLMGGDLTVESQLHQGSTFTLTLQAKAVEKPIESQSNVPNTLNILLVEDIEVNIIVAKSVLEKLGYNVDVAMTGKEGIQKFEQNYYDLVLLDIQLPDMSGFDISQYFRKKYEQGVYDFLPPLIALTANVMQSKIEYQKQGMDDVLRKPLSLEALVNCLSDYFGDELNTTVLKKSYSSDVSTFSDVLNLEMLTELHEILGKEFIIKNLSLFKQTMPGYMIELSESYAKYKLDNIAKDDLLSNAHKIKGALASVGLIRLQHLAALAQDPNTENWEVYIDEWINTLITDWLVDTQKLEDWLDELQFIEE
ncbi:hybrid sensor histidine kinase/response regulator [Canicola haemoglobinophilus]|uniref:Aerobic respiration control sensor protein n=1 Tax=Canicola haemoglobinophilus TaxID=733 RepID=A0A1V4AZB7_9PAST|nr:ATP-binding protein [Canicola haemoglobinophilus]OOR98482.1 hybrid sensor histidine kinase/response regulator [Canicola haemoglobinophilus]STO54503.1 sensor histidine kinase [Canicola haemoglobinophilus]STO60027.1 sensor histidine kinase [Canicola haemoglobinophilus]STO69037.1 sensor histidine kinase [Canicola haemoglobinophilus]